MAKTEMEGLGVEKMGKKKRRRVRIWEKGWQGWKTPPLLFSEITDYLTQINNLSLPQRWQEKEEEEGPEGLSCCVKMAR